MADYLQPVGKAGRVISIIGCTFTSLVCLIVSLLLWTDMIRRQSFEYEGKPLWIGGLVIGFIGLAAAFIAWRLVRRDAAANGITVMPVWFIQLFGILFLVGLCFASFYRGTTVFMVQGVIISLAMIFIGRQIARKRRT